MFSLAWNGLKPYDTYYTAYAKGLQMYVSRGVLKRERMLELN